MACYHPSKIDVLRKASSESARRADAVTGPCGSCPGCRVDQAGQWAGRLMHESEYPLAQLDGTPRASWFCTLTYADMPLYGSLEPEDPRLFLARLRKRFPPRTLSYYLCGEYGETSGRPHYHACLFGPRFLARERLTERHGAPVWLADALQEAWGHGSTEMTPLTYATAMYVAGYVRKKVRQRDDPEHYWRVNPLTGEIVSIAPEFARMSRSPALGRRWIERFWQDVYPRDFVVMDGRERKPPRYYDKWMETHQPEVMDQVRHQRYVDSVEIGDEKLIMKEKVHRARVAHFEKRNII